MHRFLNGSARIVEDFHVETPRRQQQASKRRKRVFETAILQVTAQLSAIEKNLDYSRFPDNTPEKVRHLLDSLQAMRLRLQTLESSYTSAITESPGMMESMESLNGKWRTQVGDTLRLWARTGHGGEQLQKPDPATTVSEDLEQKLNQLQSGTDTDNLDKQALQNIYAVIGSTQSLLDAMKELGENMRQINWQQWSTARF